MRYLYLEDIVDIIANFPYWMHEYKYGYNRSEILLKDDNKESVADEIFDSNYEAFLKTYTTLESDNYTITTYIFKSLHISYNDAIGSTLYFNPFNSYYPEFSYNIIDEGFNINGLPDDRIGSRYTIIYRMKNFLDYMRMRKNMLRMYRFKKNEKGEIIEDKRYKRTFKSTLIRWIYYGNIIVNPAKYNSILNICNYDDEGYQFWHARKLMAWYDYKDWEDFKRNVIERAIDARKGNNPDRMFRKIEDYELSLGGCVFLCNYGINPNHPKYDKGRDSKKQDSIPDMDDFIRWNREFYFPKRSNFYYE